MELKPKDIIAFFPVSIFFVIFSVCLFYNASVNGVLEKIARDVLFLTCPLFSSRCYLFNLGIIAALGAGFIAS